MKVINFFAGPGCGKSTLAAKVFYELKIKGINCELITEYAKDKTWEENYKTLENQVYVFGKQHHRMFRVSNQVDYLITDSPMIMGVVYDKENNMALRNLMEQEFKKFDNINYFIKREVPYEEAGRYQDLEGAKKLDEKIINLLELFDIEYETISVNDVEKIINNL